MFKFGSNSNKKIQKRQLMLNKINELEKSGFGEPSRLKIIRIYIEEGVELEEIDKQYMKKILREFKNSRDKSFGNIDHNKDVKSENAEEPKTKTQVKEDIKKIEKPPKSIEVKTPHGTSNNRERISKIINRKTMLIASVVIVAAVATITVGLSTNLEFVQSLSPQVDQEDSIEINSNDGIPENQVFVKRDLMVYVNNIQNLLDQTSQKYAEGEVDEAKRLAMEAYIDNYEYLEDPVEDQNEEFNDELEIMLREELQALMRNDVSPSEVDLKIRTILARVAVIVPETGQ